MHTNISLIYAAKFLLFTVDCIGFLSLLPLSSNVSPPQRHYHHQVFPSDQNHRHHQQHDTIYCYTIHCHHIEFCYSLFLPISFCVYTYTIHIIVMMILVLWASWRRLENRHLSTLTSNDDVDDSSLSICVTIIIIIITVIIIILSTSSSTVPFTWKKSVCGDIPAAAM